MPIVTPRTWVAGDVLTAAQLNVDIRDNIAFLANPPSCRVYHNAAQSVADATLFAVAFNSERYDTATMHDNVTNNGRITFPTAGIYLVTFTGQFASRSDFTRLYADILLGGVTPIAATGFSNPNTIAQPAPLNMTTVWKFAAAEFVTVRVFQDNVAGTATNLEASASNSPEFAATWLGLG